MAFAELKEKDEKDELNRPEEDGKDHLRADILGSIAGSNPNQPGYLGRIDNLITAHGAVSSPPPESASPWMAGANNGPGTTMRPPAGRMAAPLLASDQPAAESEAFSPSSSVGAPLMGPAKPQRSLLGKIGQVASRMGNIAGDVLAPGVMAMIPGTDLSKRIEANRAEASRERQEKAGLEERRVRVEEAKERREAEAAGQPKPKEEEWTIAKDYAGPNGEPVEIEKNSGTLRIAGSGISGIKRVNEKPDTETQEAQRYEGIVQKQKLKQDVSDEDKAWAGAYEKRKTLAPFATAQAQAPQKGTERSDKSFQYNNTALDKVSTPVDQSLQRLGRLNDAIAQNTPQADALIAPELLSVMAGGAGSGLRMNEAEIARIVGGRSKWESLKAAVNQWSTDPSKANSITPDQRQQIRDLVKTVQDKLAAKEQIIDDARNALLDADDPKEHRKIVADTKKKLDAIDAGEGAGPKAGDVENGYRFKGGDPKDKNNWERVN